MNIECNCLKVNEIRIRSLEEIATRHFIHFIHMLNINIIDDFLFFKDESYFFSNVKLKLFYMIYFSETHEFVTEIDFLNFKEILDLIKRYKILYIRFH